MFEEEFKAFMDSQASKALQLYVPDPTTYYGSKKDRPILKGKCSYCAQDIEFPYPLHVECIKIQIEVEKNAIKQGGG